MKGPPLEVLFGAEDSLLRCLIDMIVKLPLAVARRPQCLSVRDFHRGLAYPHNMAVAFLQNEQAI